MAKKWKAVEFNLAKEVKSKTNLNEGETNAILPESYRYQTAI